MNPMSSLQPGTADDDRRARRTSRAYRDRTPVRTRSTTVRDKGTELLLIQPDRRGPRRDGDQPDGPVPTRRCPRTVDRQRRRGASKSPTRSPPSLRSGGRRPPRPSRPTSPGHGSRWLDSGGVENHGLLKAAAGGDESAFEQVVRSFAPTVFSFLQGMLGDQREAEAGMQETFVRAARGIERYDDSDPEAWLFGIARRVAADIRPTPSRHSARHHPRTATPPSGRVARSAHFRLELREVVVLKELLRWKPDRIAGALGVEVSEVAKRLLARADAARREHEGEIAHGP